MADEPKDTVTAADRLAAALERIAQRASARPADPVADSETNLGANPAADPSDDALSVSEIAERLDRLIARLRAALDGVPKTE